MALRHYPIILSLLFILGSCTTVQHISKTDTQSIVINADIPAKDDPEANALIAPYKAQLDDVMNEVITELPQEISKQKPESPLGNLVTDVAAERLRKEGYEVDLAVINYGGLRIPYLSKGPLTRGEVFELAPFDNTLVIVEMPGEKLDSFLLLIAQTGGWPISAEARITIKDQQVVHATISGQPIMATKIYKVATVDYIANGGDNMKLMEVLNRDDTGILFRDVLIDYFMAAEKEGKKISPSVEGRIVKQ